LELALLLRLSSNDSQPAKNEFRIVSDKYARNYYVAMQRLQAPKLHDHEEPEETYGPARDEQVLQIVPQAHAAQRSEVNVHGRLAVT
jgi:hypothetical protein